MKYLELSDLVSLANNNLEPDAHPIQREGVVKNSNITLEFLDSIGDTIFTTCSVDGLKTHLLMTIEPGLATGITREKMVEDGFDFLFQNTEGKPAEWKFVNTIIDSNHEEPVEYQLRNEFEDFYRESPKRELLTGELDIKLALYYPVSGKVKDRDGIMVVEVGNNTHYRSGLVTYYNFREIPTTDVKYL